MKLFKKFIKAILFVVLYLLMVFCILAIPLTKWFNANFGITFTEIIYTLTSPLKGANISPFIGQIIFAVAALVSCGCVLFIVVKFLRSFSDRLSVKLVADFFGKANLIVDVRNLIIALVCIALVAYAVYSARFIDESLKVKEYFASRNNVTTIYEEHYVDPNTVDISLRDGKDKPKNLIYIYLESMETTYATNGTNYIPKLTELADENVSFSNTEGIGGFYSTNGTGWTIAAILASQSGVAFAFPAGYENHMDERSSFAPGLTTMGDILKDKGYYQMFLCGSDIQFAGRDKLFVHGDFEIYDYFSALDDGYAEPSDRDFWGIEDSVLYQIAKDRLLEMAQGDKPFNLTMLTLDTHFPDGYVCELCGDEYEEQFANVVACADNQVADFVDWCSQQDFYEDTVIVITGDHPFMGTTVVLGDGSGDRTVYNCFINADVAGADAGSGTDEIGNGSGIRCTDRTFTTMDMFPTVIFSLGYNIEGDRLGLGTNLFSDLDTLAEEYGLEYMSLASGQSKYYLGKFN